MFLSLPLWCRCQWPIALLLFTIVLQGIYCIDYASSIINAAFGLFVGLQSYPLQIKMMINSSSREKMPRLHAPYYLRRYYLILLLFRITVLSCCCLCTTFAKLFEPKIKKVARLTAELNALEAERLAKIVVVFGYEVRHNSPSVEIYTR